MASLPDDATIHYLVLMARSGSVSGITPRGRYVEAVYSERPVTIVMRGESVVTVLI